MSWEGYNHSFQLLKTNFLFCPGYDENVSLLGENIFEIPPFFQTRPRDLGKKGYACSLRFPPSKTNTVNKTILFFLFPVRMSILFHQNKDAVTRDLDKTPHPDLNKVPSVLRKIHFLA